MKLSSLERLKNTSIYLLWGKRCCYFFSAVFDRILFILAENDDIHKSSVEFKIRPDLTTDCRSVSKKLMLSLLLGCYLSNPFKFVSTCI